MSRIAVVGTGYVGLTTGAYLAHLGHDVVCADVVPEKVERLSRGDVPIVEPGLDELVAEGIAEGRLTFVLGASTACADAEFVFLCLPTPQGEDGSADLSYVQSAAEEIGPIVRHEAVVINKSTVPVGSTKIVEAAMGRSDVYVVSNPEFLREGSAVYDCLNPDRIVIGSDHKDAAIRVSELFSKLNAPLVVTDPASSETIKYASNAFLATKISFINAMANVCEAVGADVKEVALGMGFDKRIGFEFLKPGPGWGGSCFVGNETLLVRRKVVRRNEFIQLLSFENLFAAVESDGTDGWEALSWRDGEPTPEFYPIDVFTARKYQGDIVEVKTKMGRRITTTADHPYVVTNGIPGCEPNIKLGFELTTHDWLPVAQNFPLAYGAEIDDASAEDFGRKNVIPDEIWAASPSAKRALLRGLWDGDGSWSKTARGPSVVMEYGTVSRQLADGMLRLLGDLGIVARLKVGRTAKSTVDTYWICISGANQIEDALWLVPEDEQKTILESIDGQAKRIAATGYRRNSKNAAWVRVTNVTHRHFDGMVYSLEVRDTHKVVTTNGLVLSNCFPKDSHALVRIAEDAGYDFALLKSVVDVNTFQYDAIANKIRAAAGGTLEGRTIGVWGLTFKANTDDLRDSPALYVIDRLVAQGARIKGYDVTQTRALAPKHPTLDKIEVTADAYSAVEGADVVAVLTEWNEFRWLDFEKVKAIVASPVIVDARNLLDTVQMRRKGFEYTGVGRP